MKCTLSWSDDIVDKLTFVSIKINPFTLYYSFNHVLNESGDDFGITYFSYRQYALCHHSASCPVQQVQTLMSLDALDKFPVTYFITFFSLLCGWCVAAVHQTVTYCDLKLKCIITMQPMLFRKKVNIGCATIILFSWENYWLSGPEALRVAFTSSPLWCIPHGNVWSLVTAPCHQILKFECIYFWHVAFFWRHDWGVLERVWSVNSWDWQLNWNDTQKF